MKPPAPANPPEEIQTQGNEDALRWETDANDKADVESNEAGGKPQQKKKKKKGEKELSEASQERQAGRLPMYLPGSWVDESTFDASRVPNGYVYENKRITRVNKSSTRPSQVIPELWQILTPRQKQKLI